MSDLESQLSEDEKELYLSHQKMNSDLIRKLSESGIEIGGSYQVDYYFTSDSMENISELHHHLKEKYEYDTSAAKTRDGRFMLRGVRDSLEITEKYANRWALNMIVIGGDFGCSFGGWGMSH